MIHICWGCASCGKENLFLLRRGAEGRPGNWSLDATAPAFCRFCGARHVLGLNVTLEERDDCEPDGGCKPVLDLPTVQSPELGWDDEEVNWAESATIEGRCVQCGTKFDLKFDVRATPT